MAICRLLIFFFKINFFEKLFQEHLRVSNSLDTDQARHLVGPDLGPNCLQRILTDDTSRQRVKISVRRKSLKYELKETCKTRLISPH